MRLGRLLYSLHFRFQNTLKTAEILGNTCRAVLCKRCLCRRAVSFCLCVCLFVTFVNSVKTFNLQPSTRASDSTILFDIVRVINHLYVCMYVKRIPSGSHTILVFPNQTSWRYSDGTHSLAGASNAGGIGRNRDTQPISGSIVCCERLEQQVQRTRVRRTMAS